MFIIKNIVIISLFFALAFSSLAQNTNSVTQNKNGYNIFNPTPVSLMRELNADRPDKTDCPFTVDAGHFQVEMDFANMSYNHPNSERGNISSTAVEVAPVNPVVLATRV